MTVYRGVRAGFLTSVGVLLLAGSAFAQEATDEVEASEASSDEASPAPVPVSEPAAEPEAVAAAEAAPAEEVAEASGFSYLLFADTYATFQTAQPGTASPSHRAYSSNAPDNTSANGFGLNFVGIDLGYDSKYFGVTTSVRGGPGVIRYYGLAPSDGIIAVTQAFVTWKPTEKLSIDAGMFGTIFGAEVAESWQNLNFTRGALYFQMQPFWHTGVRASYALTEEFSINAMLVNDVNQVSLNPASKAQAAVQVAYNKDDFGAALGTLQTLGEGNVSGFDRFVDLVLTYTPDDFSLVFNGDLNISDGGGTFYGLSLAAGYRFAPAFGVALRGEFLDLDADTSNNELYTATLTLDTRPVPGVDNVVLRWDNRLEGSSGNPFFNGSGDPTDLWFASTVGLVVHTDGLF